MPGGTRVVTEGGERPDQARTIATALPPPSRRRLPSRWLPDLDRATG